MIGGLAVQVLGSGSVLGQSAELEIAPNEPGSALCGSSCLLVCVMRVNECEQHSGHCTGGETLHVSRQTYNPTKFRK